MSNYKVLYGLKILKNILVTVVESFLVLYFLNVSDSNILPLGIYKLVDVITVWCVIFFTRNIAKSKHRINLLRIGIILNFIYFLTIIILKDNIINYIYLVGFLYGLEEGFYYSVYNVIESDGVTNDERRKFVGSYTAVKSILSIIFPIVFGSLMYTTGFLKSLIIVLIIVVLKIILSFMFKDKNIPKSNKADIKKFYGLTKNDKKIKYIYKALFFEGLTYSEGAFAYIVTIYIIKVFSDSFALGVFTSIFSIVTCLLGILYARVLKKEHYPIMIKITTTLTISSLILMIFKCNAITIIIFNLFQTVSKELNSLIVGTTQSNLYNMEQIRKEFKIEYGLANETSLVIARIISSLLLISMAFVEPIYIILIFIIFLILYSYNVIRLQQTINNEEIKKSTF